MTFISKNKFFPAAILAGLVLIAIVSVWPANGQTPQDRKDRLEAPAKGLVTVVFPDLTGVEPKVAKQVESVRDLLIQSTKVGTTTKQKLGDAYGTTGMVFHTYSMFEAAIACYTNAAILLPADFRWHHLLGLVRMDQNDPKAAVREFEKAAKINPGYVPSLVRAGDANLALDLFEAAQESYKAALVKKPDEPAALFGMGQIRYQQKDYRTAAAYFERVLELVPEANRVSYALALSYRGMNETEKAKAELAKQGPVGVTVPDPILSNLLNLREGNILRLQQGKLAFDAGRPDEAIVFYREILADEPENVTALVNIGASYTRIKNYSDAAAALENAVRLHPENLNAVYNLAVVYSAQNKPFQSIALLKDVLKVRPKDVEARYLLAKELKKGGLVDEALKEYRTVVEQNPQNEQALISLVEILNARGMNKEIKERLDTAYALFPTRPWTVASYTFVLAASPDKSLRNGEQALELSQKIYKVTGRTEHGFLIVLSLAELGRCENAVELGNGFIKKAKGEKNEALAAQLTAEVGKLSKPGGCGKQDN